MKMGILDSDSAVNGVVMMEIPRPEAKLEDVYKQYSEELRHRGAESHG